MTRDRFVWDPESSDIPTDDWMGIVMKLAATLHQHEQPRSIVVDGILDADIGFLRIPSLLVVMVARR